jgi:hypothetical protein
LATHQSYTLCVHLRISGQSIHKFFKSSAVSLCQGRFQRMTQRTLQATLPTFTPVVQIGSSPGEFAGWVDLHSIRGSHKANHFPLGQNFSASHAGPLGYVFYTLNSFLRHLHLKSLR